jgi:hypothetical protein
MTILTRLKERSMDVRQCSTPVYKYLNGLRAQLSEQQSKLFLDECNRVKAEYYDSIQTWNYQQLKKFNKFDETERLATELHQLHPYIHRHLFVNSLHYAMNGAQTRVESRKRMIIKEAADEKDLEDDGDEISTSENHRDVDDKKCDEKDENKKNEQPQDIGDENADLDAENSTENENQESVQESLPNGEVDNGNINIDPKTVSRSVVTLPDIEEHC